VGDVGGWKLVGELREMLVVENWAEICGRSSTGGGDMVVVDEDEDDDWSLVVIGW